MLAIKNFFRKVGAGITVLIRRFEAEARIMCDQVEQVLSKRAFVVKDRFGYIRFAFPRTDELDLIRGAFEIDPRRFGDPQFAFDRFALTLFCKAF